MHTKERECLKYYVRPVVTRERNMCMNTGYRSPLLSGFNIPQMQAANKNA